MLNDDNSIMQLFLGVMTDHLEGCDTAKDIPFNKTDIVSGMSEAIADLDDEKRSSLANALFDLCAESVWGPFPGNTNKA